MDTRQLKSLVAIKQWGTFAKAATQVNLTPAAVGQQIAALEQELGTELFDRSTRPPTFTVQGLEVVKMAWKILRLEEETKLSLQGDLISGTLLIGSVRSSAINLLPQAMIKIKSKYPDLKTSLRIGFSSSLVYDVASGHLDAAVIAEHVSIPNNLSWKPFLNEPLWLVAPKNIELTTPEAMLRTQPFIRFKSEVPLANLIDTELSKQSIMTHDVAEVDTMSAIITFVRNGLGISIVPHIFIMEPEASGLQKLPFGTPQITRRIGIIERTKNPRQAIIEELHNHVAQQCGSYGVFSQTR